MNIQVNGVTITLTDSQLAEIRKQTEKPSAKDWLLDFLSKDFTVKLSKGYITYYRNNQWLFQQDLKNSTLWVYYYPIWKVFEIEYGMEYNAIQSLVRDVVGEALNCKGLTPKTGE